MRNLQNKVAEKLMEKLPNGKPDDLYNLTDVELVAMATEMQRQSITLTQGLFNVLVRAGLDRMDAMQRTFELAQEHMTFSEQTIMELCAEADKRLIRKECPTPQQMAALIACSHSDENHVEQEIKRRENLQ